MIELQPYAVGVFEQQRVIAGRPLILARRADDGCAKGTQEGMQLIDVGALAGAEAEMMQADAFLSNAAPACSVDGALIPTAVRPPTQ
jgi:hypothetical protein